MFGCRTRLLEAGKCLKQLDSAYASMPESKLKAVRLAYSSYESTSPVEGVAQPLIIVHGLLGSKSNWNTMAKALHSRTLRKVVAVDVRNHGDSPHARDMTYPHMAEDIRQLMSELGIGQASLVGHSMGGRAVMLLALTHPALVEKLVVVDVSPVGISPSLDGMLVILEAMRKVQLDPDAPLSLARNMADAQLSTVIRDLSLRQFILTNLVKEVDNGGFKWRVNLDVLCDNFKSHISSFPHGPTLVYPGPTLFIAGGRSDYIRKTDWPRIRGLFPAAKFEVVPSAGHWVHAEKPQDFLQIASNFLNANTSHAPITTSK